VISETWALCLIPGPQIGAGASHDAATWWRYVAGRLKAEPSATINFDVVRKNRVTEFWISSAEMDISTMTEHLYLAWPSAQVLSDQDAPVAPQGKRALLQFQGTEGVTLLDAGPGQTVIDAVLHVLDGCDQDVMIRLAVREVESRPAWWILGQSVLDEIRGVTSEAIEKDDMAQNLWCRLEILVAGDDSTASGLAQRLAEAYLGLCTGSTRLTVSVVPRNHSTSNHGFEICTPTLASLFGLPSSPVDYPSLHQLTSRHLAPPVTGHSGLLLGMSVYRGQHTPVYLSPEDRLRHVYLVGQTGTGKSTLFQSLMLQDMIAGEGCCFVDPHGDAIQWLLHRIPKHRLDDVLLFDPTDSSGLLGLNLLEWQTPHERDLLIQELIRLFYKLFDPGQTGVIGPQFEHWLRCAALTVTEPQIRGTLVDIPRLFTDSRFREAMLKRAEHPAVLAFWREQMAQTSGFHRSEMLNYFLSKFGAFLGNDTMYRLLSVRQSAFDLRLMMDQRKILLVNLSKGKLGELNAQFLGILLMAKLQMAALSRGGQSGLPPFYVFVDEFQNLATETFASMLSEVRKYGLGLHLTHQYLQQLPETVMQAVVGNVGTTLALRVGAEDAQILARQFGLLVAEDFAHVPPYHAQARTLVLGQPTTPFTLRAIPLEVEPQPLIEDILRGRIRRVARLIAGQGSSPTGALRSPLQDIA
jgi:hypothetical protein